MIYRYFSPERVDTLENNKIGLAHFRLLNDPMEGRFLVAPFKGEEQQAIDDDFLAERMQIKLWLDNNLGRFGVLCLTRSEQNELMWAHYAKGHRGFVIEFDHSHDFFKTPTVTVTQPYRYEREVNVQGYGSLRDISYEDSPMDLTVQNSEDDLFNLLFRKPKIWEYEEEVRIYRSIFKTQDTIIEGDYSIGLFDLPPKAIRRVILGARIESSLETRIKDILKKPQNSHISLEKCKFNSLDYGLTIGPC